MQTNWSSSFSACIYRFLRARPRLTCFCLSSVAAFVHRVRAEQLRKRPAICPLSNWPITGNIYWPLAKRKHSSEKSQRWWVKNMALAKLRGGLIPRTDLSHHMEMYRKSMHYKAWLAACSVNRSFLAPSPHQYNLDLFCLPCRPFLLKFLSSAYFFFSEFQITRHLSF